MCRLLNTVGLPPYGRLRRHWRNRHKSVQIGANRLRSARIKVQAMTRTPFGNPDGSRSDIKDVVHNFVTFEELKTSTGLDIRPDDLSPRVIVGAKGSGKTVYLRRLRAAAAANESVYTDVVQQDLPATSNIVKFCQCFSRRDLTEKWMQLWYCAIIRSLVSHFLHAKGLSAYLTDEQRKELEI